MVAEAFVRRPRVPGPRTPGGEVDLASPPEAPRAVPGNVLVKMLPAVMVIAVVGMVALMITVGGRGMLSNPMMLMFPLMMVMSMGGMLAGGVGRGGVKRAAELDEERKDFLRYLDNVRADVGGTGRAQRAASTWTHPSPDTLVAVAGGRRMWERRPSDHDFGHARLGVGSQRLATRIIPPETGPVDELDPVAVVALRRFVRTNSVVRALPTAVSLRAFPTLGLEGPRPDTRALARAMIAGLVTFHGPDHLRVAAVVDDLEHPRWSWLKWLPHAAHPRERDGAGAARMLYRSLAELEDALVPELAERGRFSRTAPDTGGRFHLVVIIDDGRVLGDERLVAEAGTDAVTVLDLGAPRDGPAARRGLGLVVGDGRIAARGAGGPEDFAAADAISIAVAEALARRLARYRVATAAQVISLEQDATPAVPSLMSLLRIGDAARLDPDIVWRGRAPRERLRVPIGVAPTGAPVELDIKEAAENGMGPHGLCIGATGSGKSEFLRTLVVALLATHSPEILNLVLIDFKGGATFLGLDAAPHVAAVITNLEDESAMVDRMRDALAGEMNRRQELLRSAGNFSGVTDYERARAAGAPLAPLPALFVVVDEFSELLSQRPDLAELFVMVGRLGRSLRIHLLLASQRLEEGRLRGLDSHLSYRIGLKTFSATESRAVLGVPDAYHLPAVPGAAFLKCDAGEPQRFHTCYVSGPYEPPVRDGGAAAARQAGGVRVFTAGPVPMPRPPAGSGVAAGAPPGHEPPDAAPDADGPPSAMGPSILDVVVARVADRGPRAHEVWLPPLASSRPLDELLPDGGWHPGAMPFGELVFPLGVVDRPYDQRRDVLTVVASGAEGNVAIVGGPQSGKSTALRTLVVGAAVTHDPAQAQFYILDFGGGALAGLDRLPHVGGVATRGDPDGVRRTVAEVLGVLREREVRFAACGVASMAEFRGRCAAARGGRGPGDPVLDGFGDVFLIVDGWSSIRSDFDALSDDLEALVAQGLSYGVHLVVTANRWGEIRPAVKDLIGTRIELRLGDPLDSEMARGAAASVPVGRPGRGVTPSGLHLLIAQPRLDGGSAVADIPAALAATVDAVRTVYPGSQAPRVRRLARVERRVLVSQLMEAGRTLGPHDVLIGVGESKLEPVVLDLRAQPLLLALADTECGKTTLLRGILTGLAENARPEQVKVLLVDYRRTLLGAIADEYLAGYASNAEHAEPLVAQLVDHLRERLPGSDVTQAQLRERSWWSGPDVYVVVDDYDMVVTSSANPLVALADLLGQARDVGLHVVVARRSGGASRALFDAFVGRMKDLSCDVLLGSGDRDEGYIVGRSRFQTLPPGRAELVSRSRGSEMIQIAEVPDPCAN